VSLERIWIGVRDREDVSLRQLSADLVVRKAIGTGFGCEVQFVTSVGAGVYAFSTPPGAPDGRRFALGGGFGGRFVHGPAHPVFSATPLVVLSATLSVRFRL
jgi:hypothetical protein